VYFRANRKIKRIEWWVDSDQSLINFPGMRHFSGRVAVLVDDEKLMKPRAVQVTIKNTGNVGLKTESMFRRFHIVCEGSQRIRAVAVNRVIAQQAESESVETVFDPKTGDLVLPATLLNADDALSCRLLVDGDKSSITVRGEAEDFLIKSRAGGQSDGHGNNKLTWAGLLAAVFMIFGFFATLIWGFISLLTAG
jgi:hypothetical protein